MFLPVATAPPTTSPIGSAASAVGSVVVDGPGSLLYNASNLFVGSAGIGTLRIANGGIVDSDNRGSSATITVTVGTRGRVELDGGTIIGTNIDLDGLISGSGRVRGNVAVDADAFIELAEGDLLRFENSVNNQGSITVDDGDLQFLGSLTNNAQGAFDAPGRITLQDGTVRFSSTLANNGVIASTRGTNDIHGEITNAGEVVVASNTVAVFHDSVNTTTGTIDVLPRGNALFLADATFTSAASLQLALADEGGSNESAALSVGGLATLSGNLGVSLAGGFVPTLGATYDLVRSAGGITGTFDSLDLPTLPASLEFGLIYNADSVQLAIQTATTNIIDGDYNQDDRVDAADYTVWRDTLGLMGLNLAADGNGDGKVDGADYTIWRGNFGLSAGSLSPADTAAVPEPHSVLLATLALFVGVCARMVSPRFAR